MFREAVRLARERLGMGVKDAPPYPPQGLPSPMEGRGRGGFPISRDLLLLSRKRGTSREPGGTCV